MPTSAEDAVFATLRRSHEVMSLVSRIASNVVLPLLGPCDDCSISYGTPIPMFEDLDEGPEAWTVIGRVKGYHGKGRRRRQYLDVDVSFQVSLVDDFEQVLESRIPGARHQKQAKIGIVNHGNNKKIKHVPSSYLVVDLPNDLNTGKYIVSREKTGFEPGTREDDFAPLYTGEAELELPDSIREAYADATADSR